MKRFLAGSAVGVALLVLAAVALGQFAPGNYPVLIRPSQIAQYHLKVDNSTTPNRTNIGCETDQLNTTTVNGIRIAGGASGARATIAPIACTGGDATPLLAISQVETTFIAFFPAVQYCNTDVAPSTVANLIPTRLASNDWALARTAAGAETYNIHCVLPLPWRSTASKGARLDSFSISQQITVAALTSNTFNALSTTTYANATANAVAAYGGTITITMPTAIQATPYLTAATVGTPAFMTTTNAQVAVDFTVVMANLGVYRLYGIAATYSLALY